MSDQSTTDEHARKRHETKGRTVAVFDASGSDCPVKSRQLTINLQILRAVLREGMK